MRATTSSYARKRPKAPWSFERKITLGLISFVIFHTFGAFFYAGKLDNRVSNMEQQNQDMRSDIRDIRNYLMDKK
jgi:CHASE3 domain sensor protein